MLSLPTSYQEYRHYASKKWKRDLELMLGLMGLEITLLEPKLESLEKDNYPDVIAKF